MHRLAIVQIRHAKQLGGFINAFFAQRDGAIFDIDGEINVFDQLLFGLLIALLPAALMALTLSPAKAGIVVAAYLIYHQLESHLIGPKVYGNTLGLSLTVIVISIMIGVELMGLLVHQI